jgi:RNA polymerase sigma-70 factor (ECF subfamily)
MLTFEKMYEMYEMYAADVYRFAYWLCGERADAEDVTSETFIRAWTSDAPIRTETLKAYLLAIARNLCFEQQRKGKRQTRLEEWHTDGRAGPEDVATAREALAQMRKHLETLPAADRDAFLLRFQHDLPYAEIARVLGVSETLAKVKVHRARLTLSRLRKE